MMRTTVKFTDDRNVCETTIEALRDTFNEYVFGFDAITIGKRMRYRIYVELGNYQNKVSEMRHFIGEDIEN